MGLNISITYLAIFAFLLSSLHAQENFDLLSHNYHFPDTEKYEELELFGIALSEAESSVLSENSFSQLAINSYRIDESRSIDFLLEAAERSSDKQNKTDAYFLIAEKHFERKDYKQSLKYWSKINLVNLDLRRRSVLEFKIAYCYLVDKNFASADPYFSSVADSNHKLSYSASYYEGICAFYLSDRERAISSFQKIENHKRYKKLVPFYLAQIYFKDQEYDRAIKYGHSKISNTGADSYLMERILGLSYMINQDYVNAIIHLENYANDSDKISENEAFQLARANYELGRYEEAQSYFKELSYQESEIGQMSNFLLASTSIENGNKKDAQSAFKQASKLHFFPEIQEESEFLYYKLSAELGDQRVAINGFSTMNSNNRYYAESQEILAKLLYNSNDTENGIQVIESLSYKSESILNTYQSLSYQRGMQLMNDAQFKEAIHHFENALNINLSSIPSSELEYRLGLSNDKIGDYTTSESWLTKYLSNTDNQYRFESYYLLAYQSMDDKQYNDAIHYLENSLENFDTQTDQKILFDDVLIRLADLELVNNNYEAALEYYQLAIQNKAVDTDYILYQKALIYGVNNQIIEKLTSLENLLKSYPESNYRDDALFQLAETLMQLKKNNQAYQVYSSIILEFGKGSEFAAVSHMRQGLISYNQGDLYAALDSYKQGISLSTNKNEQRRTLLAIEDIYLYELNDPEAYFKYSESFTGIKIDNISRDSIVFNIALNTYKDAHYEIAIEKFNSYLDRYPDGFYKIDVNYYLAESYLVLKKYPESLTAYQNVIEAGGSKFRYSTLEKAAVIAYNYSQNYELSFNLYDKLIEENSAKAELSHLEAALHSAFITERWSQVIKYGELVSTDLNSESDLIASAHYYMAKAFMASKNHEEALFQFNMVQTLPINYQSAESSYTISQIYYLMNDLDKAEDQAMKTANSASSYPYWVSKSILLLADIYSERKDYLNATAAYESIIENFKDKDILNEAKNKLKKLENKIQEESRIQLEDENSGFMTIDTSTQNK